MSFEYTITQKKNIAVISLNGDLGKDSKVALEKLHAELLECRATFFIFYFKNVTQVDHSTFKTLTMMQHDLRKQKFDISIIGLDPKLRSSLVDKAIIRSSEIKKDMAEALSTIVIS